MGNDIVAHRIVIGLFYHKIGMACCRKVKLIVSFNLYDILHWFKETFSIDVVWMEF
jgi:hypothetical protein